MPAVSNQLIRTFTDYLAAIADLPERALQSLEGLVGNIRPFAADQDIVRQGDRPSQCCVILDGWISRNRILDNGRRQVAAIHFAGTVPDLQSLFMPVMDHNITTLTDAQVGFIPHENLRTLIEREPGVVVAFWKETLIDAAISRAWVINLGIRQAQERIAHLLCEVSTRLERLGRSTRIADHLTVPWPLNQAQLAEITGMSAVHVNRSLQALRADGLIDDRRGWMTVCDVPRLMAFASFDADYLQAEMPRNKQSIAS